MALIVTPAARERMRNSPKPTTAERVARQRTLIIRQEGETAYANNVTTSPYQPDTEDHEDRIDGFITEEIDAYLTLEEAPESEPNY